MESLPFTEKEAGGRRGGEPPTVPLTAAELDPGPPDGPRVAVLTQVPGTGLRTARTYWAPTVCQGSALHTDFSEQPSGVSIDTIILFLKFI